MTDSFTQSRPIDDGKWCPRGCQPLLGLGECFICGYEGDGVPEDENREVIDFCEETGRYTRQDRSGFCYGCGKQHSAEEAEAEIVAD